MSGRDSYGSYILSDCHQRASSCSTITLTGGTIYFPGAVQWDGTRSEWVVWDQLCGDSDAACSYPVSASGVLGTPTQYENYEGTGDCDMVQGVIGGNKHGFVIGGEKGELDKLAIHTPPAGPVTVTGLVDGRL